MNRSAQKVGESRPLKKKHPVSISGGEPIWKYIIKISVLQAGLSQFLPNTNYLISPYLFLGINKKIR